MSSRGKKSFQLLPFHTAHVLYSVILLDSAYNTDTKPYRLFSIYMPSRLQLLSENTKLDQTRKPLKVDKICSGCCTLPVTAHVWLTKISVSVFNVKISVSEALSTAADIMIVAGISISN